MTRVMIDPPAPGVKAQWQDGAPAAFGDAAPLVARMDAMFPALPDAAAGRLPPSGPAISDSALFLSGGSQNGAFGAGYLGEWARRRSAAGKGGLPRFRLVTGVSTGALQSTFAFLGEPAVIADSYTIASESELLDVFTPGGGLRSKSRIEQARGGLSLARRGAMASLQPLRAQLAGTGPDDPRALISDAVLRRVAAEAGPDPEHPRRMLLVGAVEMDSGDAFVFDLTMAARLYAGGMTEMRACYIEALMASSSVPMAALPVFIEGKMFIDGGARFGIISDFTAAVLQHQAQRRMAAMRAVPAPPPAGNMNLFILVNGTLEAGTTCHLKDCAEHPLPTTPGHGPWSFDKLALRSMSILINQSYRSSVFWATQHAEPLGFRTYFVKMEKDSESHPTPQNTDNPAGEVLTCAQWRARDVEKSRPLEFHPRFMRCLISYGAKRADEKGWDGLE